MKYNQETGKIQKLTDEVNNLTEQVNSLSVQKSYIPGGINFINKNVKYETDWIYINQELISHNWELYQNLLYFTISLDGQVAITHGDSRSMGEAYCTAIVDMQVPEEFVNYVKLNIFFKSNDEGMSILRNYCGDVRQLQGPRDESIKYQVCYPGKIADVSGNDNNSFYMPLLIDTNNCYRYRYTLTTLAIVSGSYRGYPSPVVWESDFFYPIWAKFVITIDNPHKYDETIETIKII